MRAICSTENVWICLIYYIIMFNGVLLVAMIATWVLKVTSLPKLNYNKINEKVFFTFTG